jgi:glycine cleavage system aminomethyltransferase T/glycine/D-amino acid oxidase-like deaminating enzyme
MNGQLPSRAQVVVIGGGVMGVSTAYHLTKLGWRDVIVLEQGTLSCGTTWHAAGLVGPLRATESGTRLVQYSAELYAALESETGLSTGYTNVGGLVLARTKDRMTALRRTAANAAAYDLACELITPQEAQRLWPLLQVEDILGAIWLPGDGKVNPTDLTMSLAKGARLGGAQIFERVRVVGITTTDDQRKVSGVITDQGELAAEVVVNCAGQWAKALGDLVEVPVPLHSAEHFYVVTEPMDGVHPELPVLRDPDGYTYFKEEVGGLVVGGFEPAAKPWVSPSEIPYPFEFQLLEEDWEHFSVLMESAVHRIPALADTGIRKFYNGPESFTPDNQFLLGEAPGLRGFFVGAGFNSVGIASAGGAGRALAEWITAGEAPGDLWGVDIRRFAAFHADNGWLRERVAEVLGLHYEVPWPDRELLSARPQRVSPLYDATASAGAVFGSRMGWERPNYFASSEVPEPVHTWGQPNWVGDSVTEQLACRQRVAIFDQSSFSKYVVTGSHALADLQWICAADVNTALQATTYTPWLNARGTYEADLTVTRVSEQEFLIISSSATTVRDLDWLDRHLSPSTTVIDLTEDFAVLGVMGPASRDLLRKLSPADLSEVGFPFGTSREIDLVGAQVRATRMTYVGELGWELLIPVRNAPRVYEALFDVGEELGVTNAGYYALEALRLEKGFCAFGRELTSDYRPTEAGLVFATALKDQKPFLGREALAAHKQALLSPSPRRRLVSVLVDDPEVMLWGGELVLLNGQPAGQVTSAAFGATVGASVGLAYIRAEEPVTRSWLASRRAHVNVAGAIRSATLSLRAPLR